MSYVTLAGDASWENRAFYKRMVMDCALWTNAPRLQRSIWELTRWLLAGVIPECLKVGNSPFVADLFSDKHRHRDASMHPLAGCVKEILRHLNRRDSIRLLVHFFLLYHIRCSEMMASLIQYPPECIKVSVKRNPPQYTIGVGMRSRYHALTEATYRRDVTKPPQVRLHKFEYTYGDTNHFFHNMNNLFVTCAHELCHATSRFTTSVKSGHDMYWDERVQRLCTEYQSIMKIDVRSPMDLQAWSMQRPFDLQYH